MHLVFLNQYYPPDAAPTGVMLEAVVERLVRDGHEVTVLCASGGYAGSGRVVSNPLSEVGVKVEAFGIEPEQRPSSSTDNRQPTADNSSIRILRIGATSFGRGTFAGKLLDYASYYVGVAWTLMVMRRKPDRIVALTTPPLLSVLARLLSRIRGCDHAHWVMDLYPDVMAAHGMLGESSAVYRILAGLARWGFGGRRQAAVLTLGPDMAERCGRVVSGPFSVVGGRGRSGAEAQPTTDNRQPTSVSWVPLWSTGGSGASVTVAFCSGGGDGEWGDSELKPSAPLSRLSPIGTSAAVADAPLQAASALRAKRGWADGELIVMYSGNMGLGHRFGEILAAAGRVREESSVVSDPLSVELPRGAMAPRTTDHRPPTTIPVGEDDGERVGSAQAPRTTDNRQPTTPELSLRFVFFGGGKRRVEVEAFVREHPGCGVELHDYALAAELTAHLQSADVHLASLDAAWTGTMVPSKLQGIFGAGRPVIFIGSAESSIGRWVAESGGGWVVPPGDADGLLAALVEARDPEIRLTRGRAAKDFADQHFDRQTNVTRVAAILAQTRE